MSLTKSFTMSPCRVPRFTCVVTCGQPLIGHLSAEPAMRQIQVKFLKLDIN
jgi:hypothetical protein